MEAAVDLVIKDGEAFCQNYFYHTFKHCSADLFKNIKEKPDDLIGKIKLLENEALTSRDNANERSDQGQKASIDQGLAEMLDTFSQIHKSDMNTPCHRLEEAMYDLLLAVS